MENASFEHATGGSEWCRSNVSNRAWPCLLLGCVTRAHSLATLDEPVGNLRGPELGAVQVLTSAAAALRLNEPCPPGAVATGWWYRIDGWIGSGPGNPWTVWTGAWCEDAQRRLQGPSLAVEETAHYSVTISGHYRDGIAHGRFVGHQGSATYAHGLLEGPCELGFTVVVFHDGVEVGRVERPVPRPEPDPPRSPACEEAGGRHIQCVVDFSEEPSPPDDMMREPEPLPTSCPFHNDDTVHHGPVLDGWPQVLPRPASRAP